MSTDAASAPAPVPVPAPADRPAPAAGGARARETLALGLAAVAFVVVALVALPVFRLQPAPIAGEGSIGQFAAIASAVVAMLAFAAGRYVVHQRLHRPRMRVLDILDIVALSIAHGVIALLSWTLLADVMERGFLGATVFPVPLLILSGAAAAVTAYVSFLSAVHMDLPLLAIVLAVFLAEGVIASTLTASNPRWWLMNLSALGMTDDVSALAFNLTLIVAGFIVTTLARYVTAGLPASHPRGPALVRVSLIVVGVFLACVGFFHVDEFFAIHTGAASGMAVAFCILVARIHVWVPGMSRAFLAVGWVFVAAIVVLAVFFAIGYYTLTAVELVAGLLVFTWIILFIRNAAALAADERRAASRA